MDVQDWTLQINMWLIPSRFCFKCASNLSSQNVSSQTLFLNVVSCPHLSKLSE